MLNIQPVGGRILVEQLPAEEYVTDGGIIQAASVKANLVKARVVAVSSKINHLYKPEDIVIFPEGKGVGQPHAGKFYLWLNHDADEVWGIELQENYKIDNGDNL